MPGAGNPSDGSFVGGLNGNPGGLMTQFSSWNTSATFNAQGQQVNAAFGQANGARLPRNIQLSARFVF